MLALVLALALVSLVSLVVALLLTVGDRLRWRLLHRRLHGRRLLGIASGLALRKGLALVVVTRCLSAHDGCAQRTAGERKSKREKKREKRSAWSAWQIDFNGARFRDRIRKGTRPALQLIGTAQIDDSPGRDPWV